MATLVRVLVVAVDRTTARAEAAWVNRLPGFRATATVGSAAAAVRRLRKGGVDLLLLDRLLPDGDGVEFAARVRALERRGDVLFTTSTQNAARPSLAPRPPGAAGELVRPFSFEGFRETLMSWAAARPAAGPAEPGPARRARGGRPSLPRGLRPDTLDAVMRVVRERWTESAATPPSGEPAGLSATAVASAIGSSRVTVRRYLDHLTDAGVLIRSLHRRAAGRPEALYRPGAQHG